MRIEQLEYLIAIYHYRSMNLAGERIHVSQQAISAAITQLEEEFGVPLVIRTKRGSLLTPDGRALAELAENFFAECEHLRHKPRQEQPTELNILMSPYDDEHTWSHILLYFYNNYPQTRLQRLALRSPNTKAELLAHPEAVALTYASDLEIRSWANTVTYELLAVHYLYLVTSQASSIPDNQKTISINAIKNRKVLFMCAPDEPSAISTAIDQYPLLKANNTCLYQLTCESFYQLLAQDKDTIGIIPLCDTAMTTFKRHGLFYNPAANFRFLKLSENIIFHFCCASLLPAIPAPLVTCLRQLSP